jgi:hypothetical protein
VALTLGQGAQMVADVGYSARIRSGMVRYAGTVMAEALNANSQNPGTTGAKRKQLATRILQSPDTLLPAFLAVVASDPGASLSWFQPTLIASSTNANPSMVTTASVHGLAAGDVVEITGHLVNTAINGVWTIATVGSTTTFTVPMPANGASGGGATGQVMKMETDVNINFTIQNQFSAVAGTGSWDTG